MLLTTVGYGDLYPQNYAGRCVAALASFFGIGTVALLSGIFGSGFVELYEEDKAKEGKLDQNALFFLPRKIELIEVDSQLHRAEVSRRLDSLETSVQSIDRTLQLVLERLESR